MPANASVEETASTIAAIEISGNEGALDVRDPLVAAAKVAVASLLASGLGNEKPVAVSISGHVNAKDARDSGGNSIYIHLQQQAAEVSAPGTGEVMTEVVGSLGGTREADAEPVVLDGSDYAEDLEADQSAMPDGRTI